MRLPMLQSLMARTPITRHDRGAPTKTESSSLSTLARPWALTASCGPCCRQIAECTETLPYNLLPLRVILRRSAFNLPIGIPIRMRLRKRWSSGRVGRIWSSLFSCHRRFNPKVAILCTSPSIRRTSEFLSLLLPPHAIPLQRVCHLTSVLRVSLVSVDSVFLRRTKAEAEEPRSSRYPVILRPVYSTSLPARMLIMKSSNLTKTTIAPSANSRSQYLVLLQLFRRMMHHQTAGNRHQALLRSGRPIPNCTKYAYKT